MHVVLDKSKITFKNQGRVDIKVKVTDDFQRSFNLPKIYFLSLNIALEGSEALPEEKSSGSNQAVTEKQSLNST